MLQVAATEFAKRFARYRRAAQREPVAVTHHGETTEVLLSREAFEEYQTLKRRVPRHLWAWELSEDWLAELAVPVAEKASEDPAPGPD